MIWPIERLSIEEFEFLIKRLAWQRQIDCVHVHHTWRPNHAQWRGSRTVEAMRRVHVEDRGFSDIAQHLTIDPFGGVWTGRNWNQAPASARGRDANGRAWNGDRHHGPFMIELVGDFDDGRDVLAGGQYDAAVLVIALILWRFQLQADGSTVKSHCQMDSSKSCPGTSLTASSSGIGRLNQRILRDIETARLSILGRLSAPVAIGGPIPTLLRHFLQDSGRDIHEALSDPDSVANQEVPEDAAAQQFTLRTARALSGLDTVGYRAAVDLRFADLYGHVVNTARGLLLESPEQINRTGLYWTSQDELETSFFRALDEFERGLPEGEPLRLMVHAHGGLVSEDDALSYAKVHAPWWRGLSVFPVYFVWETGLIETTLGHQRSAEGERGLLDWLFERTDQLVEAVTGRAGQAIWRSMKVNAALCSSLDWHESHQRLQDEEAPAWVAPGVAGGAVSFARALLANLRRLDGKREVEVHAVGHSAGAIFQSHFLPMFSEEIDRMRSKVKLCSLQLLAPALRIDEFEERVAPLVLANAIDELAVYTMDDRREREDSVGPYRKSLLYLVNEAYEVDADPGLVGLARSLDQRLALPATATAKAFSKPRTQIHYSQGRVGDVTAATRHGDFDNDVATMTSVARVVCGLARLPQAYGSWVKPRPKRKHVKRVLANSRPAAPAEGSGGGRFGARRRALCIGIDDYPSPAALAGCVNDARAWGSALGQIGFEVDYLLNDQASRAGLQRTLSVLLEASVAGDALVLQFAGHGTQFQDLNGDEGSGLDQAFVPHDYQQQGCLLDDELYRLLQPAAMRGVRITLFFDSCHAGSASRLAPLAGIRADASRRARYLPATVQMAALQRRVSGTGSRSGSGTPDRSVDWIHLAACKDEEYAFETGGSGDFTRITVPLLATASERGWTGDQLHAEVLRQFGPGARQTPTLMPSRVSDRAVLPAGGASQAADGRAALIGALQAALAAAQRL